MKYTQLKKLYLTSFYNRSMSVSEEALPSSKVLLPFIEILNFYFKSPFEYISMWHYMVMYIHIVTLFDISTSISNLLFRAEMDDKFSLTQNLI